MFDFLLAGPGGAQVLASLGERTFQVEGHTDNVPIATERYPSNWELASDRALVVHATLRRAAHRGVRVLGAAVHARVRQAPGKGFPDDAATAPAATAASR